MADRNSAINRAAQSPGARRQNTGSGSETAAAGRKRDSRAGTRKVTSLTTEQLERKRANDREAQRTIRQRTREHIENLEHQVAELSAKSEQMDQVIQRNAALEAEIAHLRQQLTIMSSSRPLYPGEEERRSSTSSNATSAISSPFNSPPVTEGISTGPSIATVANRLSVAHSGWHSYVPPSSVSEPEPASEVAAYAMAESISAPSIHPPVNQVGQGHGGMAFSMPHPTQFPPESYHNQIYPSRMVGQQGPPMGMSYESGVPPNSVQMQMQSHHQPPQQAYQAQLHPPVLNTPSQQPQHGHISYQWDSPS